jgi:hypothetical protein
MLHLRRALRIGLAVGLSILLPAAASADDLRVPTIAASAAAAADWASTYHALKYYKVREVNPLLRPFDREPGAMISLGAAIDIGVVSAWNVALGRKHPRVAVTGLWAMAAFRTYLAVHNIRNERRSARRDSR